MTYSRLEAEAQHFYLEFSKSMARNKKSGRWISELVISELAVKTMTAEMLVKEYSEALFLALEADSAQVEDSIRYFILGTVIYSINNKLDAAAVLREAIDACLFNYVDRDMNSLCGILKLFKRTKGQAARYLKKQGMGTNDIADILGKGFADGINKAFDASGLTNQQKKEAIDSAGVSRWYKGYFIDYIKDAFWP
ncbi:MAG: hypothetical protein AABZ57_00365 [Candidatus Margulisiibacteriota bacterium]